MLLSMFFHVDVAFHVAGRAATYMLTVPLADGAVAVDGSAIFIAY